MAKSRSSADLERERVRMVEREREIRLRSWSQARNEGIREGMLMAMTAARGGQPPIARCSCCESITARGDRHFGDSKWQAERRPG